MRTGTKLYQFNHNIKKLIFNDEILITSPEPWAIWYKEMAERGYGGSLQVVFLMATPMVDMVVILMIVKRRRIVVIFDFWCCFLQRSQCGGKEGRNKTIGRSKSQHPSLKSKLEGYEKNGQIHVCPKRWLRDTNFCCLEWKTHKLRVR